MVAGGSSVGLAYKLNQALSLPIVSLLQGLFLHSEGPVLHLLWDTGRERRGEGKKEHTVTAKMSRKCSEYWRREKYAQNSLDVQSHTGPAAVTD